MARHRISAVLSSLRLLAALVGGPGVAAADGGKAPAGDSCGFGAPEGPQISAAREHPERLHVSSAAGASKPVALPPPQGVAQDVAAAVADLRAVPLFLVHCVFLC